MESVQMCTFSAFEFDYIFFLLSSACVCVSVSTNKPHSIKKHSKNTFRTMVCKVFVQISYRIS